MTALPSWLRPFAGLAILAALALVTLSAPTLGQDKKGDKGDKKDQKKDDKKKEEKKDERIYPKTDPLVEIKGHDGWVTRVVYTPDGKQLVTASKDRTVRVWDAIKGTEIFKIKDLPDKEMAMALSPDGTKVVATAGKFVKEKSVWVGEINIYDVKKGKILSTLKGHSDEITAVAFSPKGDRLATASKDGTAKVWELADKGKELLTLKGHGGKVLAIAWSEDGKWIATGSEDKTAKLWDADNGKDTRTFKGPTRDVSCVAFSKDSGRLAMGSLDNTIYVWDLGSGNELYKLNADEGVWAVAFSPDGSKLAAGGWSNVVQLWDMKNAKEIGGLAGHSRTIVALTFNAAGDRIVTASVDQTVRVWDVAAARQKVEPPKKEEPKKEEKKDDKKI
jgi:WD40 repeat protein